MPPLPAQKSPRSRLRGTRSLSKSPRSTKAPLPRAPAAPREVEQEDRSKSHSPRGLRMRRNIHPTVFLPHRGGGGLRSEAEQDGAGSRCALRRAPLRLASRGTSPTMGEESNSMGNLATIHHRQLVLGDQIG